MKNEFPTFKRTQATYLSGSVQGNSCVKQFVVTVLCYMTDFGV